MDMWLLAGMRVVVLTDLARFRLQSLSFFLLIILVCAWIVQRIWNYLGWDFPRLPKLSYGKALGVTVLWGLLFVIVLAMISGARELMTPGAWVKQPNGGYTLTDGGVTREQRLEQLKAALWEHADRNDGVFPDTLSSLSGGPWTVPGTEAHYVLVKWRTKTFGDSVLAYEPPTQSDRCLVLLCDGRIVERKLTEVVRLVEEQPS